MSNAQPIPTVDPRWKDLYRIGGIASLLLAGLIAFAVIAYFIWPYTPGFASTEDIFAALQTDRLLGSTSASAWGVVILARV